MSDLKRYTADKLKCLNTYFVAAIVGSFINLYGHVLVPMLRSEQNPVDQFLTEFMAAPAVVSLSSCWPTSSHCVSASTRR